MMSETARDPVADENPADGNEISAQTKARLSFQVYDDFDAPGYSLTDYAKRWILPYGVGEMALNDTRDFSGGCLSLSALPFQTSSEATDVGVDKMYTQVIREVPVRPGVWHHVDIALTRHDGDAWVDYFLDHRPVSHVENVGIPLDKQGASFTGIYPSLGSGERLADQLTSVRYGHGLFSLLDAFPFQHPGAPELSVSIPAPTLPLPDAAGRARLYGQGASGSFDNFTTLTISGSARPPSPSEILSALAASQGSEARRA
jgi:hypothetical protein